jgi:diaminohydroxyphosphoribosylaminopyrimidine deaminase/5-amino-6-(5-phosphoribosylamino)uracil reductase
VEKEKHISFMKRALQLAKLGCKAAYPNPMVGAVIVHNDKIICEGWHKEYGKAHAEVNAINNVENQELLKDSTIYVTLEPCSHHGKTPPCSDLIIEKGIKEVVIGCIDTFSKVSGRGIAKLEKAGIKVHVGVLEKEARRLNKRFFTFHEKKRPYVILKWAESNDGFIDIERTSEDRKVNWITQKETKSFVHHLRSKEHAIMVGWKTIKNDDPSLTVREIDGLSPIRFIIDPNCKSPKESKVFNDGLATYLICKKNKYSFSTPTMKVIELETFELPEILNKLHSLNILSVFIEGGAFTLQKIIDLSLWDEAYKIQGAPFFQKGIPAPNISDQLIASNDLLGQDRITLYSNK